MTEFRKPSSWGDTAATIVETRYARPHENSVEEITDRITRAWRDGLETYGYMEDAGEFILDVKEDMMDQVAAPNSPQWFNTGINEKPQVHACFINEVEDDLGSISDLWHKETRIFKNGSGSGVNFSKVREEGAPLSGGGTSSGVMSFLKVGDANAGAIKSGGTTRRAALMRILDVDHPDIMEFINWKGEEEKKVRYLVEGSGGNLNYDWRGEAYRTVSGQNSNNSVRVTDEFMEAALNDMPWELNSRVDGVPPKVVSAKGILESMAKAAWASGDPAVFFGDTIQEHNTVLNDEEIVSSNPCCEYLFLNNTACNLASINLAALYRKYGPADFIRELFCIVERWITILDVSIDIAGYPTEEFEKKTKEYRTLGLGFTGLHEYLILNGLKYASKEGRDEAASIMQYIKEAATKTSVNLATKLGPCPAWERNKEFFEREYNTSKPMRNSQLTCIAPTGTISLVMGAASSGIEPVFSEELVKTLSGGGELTLKAETGGETASTIPPMDHLEMVAAVQKYVCGGISKTINMPNSATWEDIKEIYVKAWKLGLKAVSVYRDGSKGSQPVTDKANKVVETRKRLPHKRSGYTQRVRIDDQSMYIRTGEYEDGKLGELFLDMGKEGGAYGGLLSAFAKSISIGLQYGVPLSEFTSSFVGTRMQPSGFVFDHDKIKMCTSTVDLVFRDLELNYLSTKVDSHKISESCPECGGFNMVSTGTCSTCQDCGATTGCA